MTSLPRFQRWRDVWSYTAFAVFAVTADIVTYPKIILWTAELLGAGFIVMGLFTVIWAPTKQTRTIGFAAIGIAVTVYPAALYGLFWLLRAG
jgi:hypothetical protein